MSRSVTAMRETPECVDDGLVARFFAAAGTTEVPSRRYGQAI